MARQTKLFGFTLNDTSGVLLFIFALFFLLGGAMMIYTAIEIYNTTGYAPPLIPDNRDNNDLIRLICLSENSTTKK